MSKDNQHRRKKGSFSSAMLSISPKYIFPVKFRLMILLGLLASVVVLGYFAFDWLMMSATFSSPGPVSSNHATFEQNCDKCHDLTNAVTDDKCSSCHEKFGEQIGVYTYSSHYLYRSKDYSRIKSAGNKHISDELNCYDCHQEHNGRMAAVTNVPDAKCITCHDYGSFDDNHPEFQFLRDNIPDDSALLFTHIRHTDFVSKFLAQKGKRANIEETCLYCHNAKQDGKTFEAINYEKHCADCHLTASAETPLLTVAGSSGDAPGVETLAMVRKRLGPGTRWAFYLNPNEFTDLGGRKVKKSPVYHEDPWILENLRLIRNKILVGQGLEAILNTVPNPQDYDSEERYFEIIAMLEDFADQLRGRPEPEIQQDLLIIDSLINMVTVSIKSNRQLLSSNQNSVPVVNMNPGLTQNEIDAQQQLANDLTSANNKLCQECHIVANAGIVSYNGGQRRLIRAEFDHYAHIMERQCLDCHNIIPVTKEMNPDENAAKAIDVSSTTNIPGIDNCLECHSSGKAASSCVSCHYFHPNKEQRGNLRLFAE